MKHLQCGVFLGISQRGLNLEVLIITAVAIQEELYNEF